MELNRRGLIAGLAAATALPACSLSGCSLGGPVAETASGKVRGLVKDGVRIFRGVRYGADTGGANRFRAPQPPQPWSGVRPATKFGAGAPQLGREGVGTSEDCLWLNVYTPGLDAARRPVMVWLHAGGFARKNGNAPDGSHLARNHGVVVVTLNHRLNVLAWLGLGQGAPDRYPDAGEVGMLDILAALKWVQTNIERFGGDPGRVTVFGQSGGGRKVSTLMAMPAGKGLFHRAIVQSGSQLRLPAAEEGAAQAEKISRALGASGLDVDLLARTPVADLLKAANTAVGMARLMPLVDGRNLPRHPFDPDAPAISRDVPMIIGTNRTEASATIGVEPGIDRLSDPALKTRLAAVVPEKDVEGVLAMYRRLYPQAANDEVLEMATTDRNHFLDATIQAGRKADQKGAPAYVYSFERETPVGTGRMHTPHQSEVPLAFDEVAEAPGMIGPATPELTALAGRMSSAWCEFARTGVPSAKGLPSWPVYDSQRRPTMILNYECRVQDDPRGEQRKTMLAFGSMQDDADDGAAGAG